MITDHPGLTIKGGYLGTVGQSPGGLTNEPTILTQNGDTDVSTRRIVEIVSSTVTVVRVTIQKGRIRRDGGDSPCGLLGTAAVAAGDRLVLAGTTAPVVRAAPKPNISGKRTGTTKKAVSASVPRAASAAVRGNAAVRRCRCRRGYRSRRVMSASIETWRKPAEGVEPAQGIGCPSPV